MLQDEDAVSQRRQHALVPGGRARRVGVARALALSPKLVIAGEPTAEIFRRPRHPRADALLSATPEPDPDAAIDGVEIKGEVPSLMQRPGGCEFRTRCLYAREKCMAEPPAGSEAGPGHSYTCCFPLESARGRVDPPRGLLPVRPPAT